MFRTIFCLFIICNASCGIKGKPLPPLETTTQETGSEPIKVKKK